MKKFFVLFWCLLGLNGIVLCQQVTVSPAFPTPDQPLTITVDVTGTSLDNFAWDNNTNPVWIWAWIAEGCTSNCDAPTNVNPATSAQDAAKVSRISTNPDKYQITFVPTSFFNKPASQIQRIGLKLKTRNWSDNKQTDNDRFINFASGVFEIAFSEPSAFPIFKNSGESITISGNASASADLSLLINDVEVATALNATSISVNHVISETSSAIVKFKAIKGAEILEKTFAYIIRQNTPEQARPEGIRTGINYNTADPSRVTLNFLAPQKSSVYVIGDFNNWEVSPQYQMFKDNEYFWIELTGLEAGKEYAYQFLVDETIYTADPFADKILDPDNDSFISESIYPALKDYLTGKAAGIVSVLQTGQDEYQWQATDYTRPVKEKLNIYELLVRDFDTEKSYQAVINRLDYLKDMGINAIELMPIMEFSGNISWGYNPIFYLAPDKAYGTKNKLKELIDEAHKRGMAVILDMVLNQADYEFPYVKMYWDNGKPAATSPFFNRDAKHPFNVFFDFNHDSPYTENLVDTVNLYWLSEYKFDGFRFDLSKGFTQTFNTDVNAWSNYDQSRVDNLVRMANRIWDFDPTAYVMLEHLGVDEEERVLSNAGMMLWGKLTDNYKQNVLGYADGSAIDRTYYKARSGTWNNPAAIISYIESHDEERVIYNSLQFGNANGSYSTKNLNTALERMKGAHALFFSVPGPKMVWQFGELGYDFSINTCENGTVSIDCRTSPKPIRWDYFDVNNRRRLQKVITNLQKLRNQHQIFQTSDVTFTGGASLVKSVILKSVPFVTSPATTSQMSVVTIANFNLSTNTSNYIFPHQGTWYDYFSGGTPLNVTAASASITLQPGEFRLYTNVKLEAPEEELTNYALASKPVISSITESSGSVQINWEDNSAIEIRYIVYRKLASAGSYTKLAELPANSESYNDENIDSDQTYSYYVAALNLANRESPSEAVEFTTSVVTSLYEISNDNFVVYPNPSSGKFVIEDLDSSMSFDIINTLGQSVSFLMEESHLEILAPSGLYFLKVQNGNQVFVVRLMKQ